jgi:hypothetical protein
VACIDSLLAVFNQKQARLFSHVEALADAMDLPLPDASLAAASGEESDEEDEEDGDGTDGLSLWQGGDGDGGVAASLGPFGDEDTRQFYTRLPDLLASVRATKIAQLWCFFLFGRGCWSAQMALHPFWSLI